MRHLNNAVQLNLNTYQTAVITIHPISFPTATKRYLFSKDCDLASKRAEFQTRQQLVQLPA